MHATAKAVYCELIKRMQAELSSVFHIGDGYLGAELANGFTGDVAGIRRYPRKGAEHFGQVGEGNVDVFVQFH